MPSPMFDPLRFSRPASHTPEQRLKMIADAAYFRAEKRGFQPGFETEDWLAAEVEVDMELMYRGFRAR